MWALAGSIGSMMTSFAEQHCAEPVKQHMSPDVPLFIGAEGVKTPQHEVTLRELQYPGGTLKQPAHFVHLAYVNALLRTGHARKHVCSQDVEV